MRNESLQQKLIQKLQFHCHNLVHEDHLMMDVFNTTANPWLKEIGYGDSQAFDDPMDPTYTAKDVDLSLFNLDSVINTVLPAFLDSAAYKNEQAIVSALSSYYLTNTYGEPSTAVDPAAQPTAYGEAYGGAYPTAAQHQNQGASPTGSATNLQVAPSAYAFPAPFTFTEAVPTQVRVQSAAVVQPSASGSIEMQYFSYPSRPTGAPTWGGAPGSQFGGRPAGPPSTPSAAAPAPAASALSAAAAAPAPAASAPPAAAPVAPAPTTQAAAAPAQSYGPPAGMWNFGSRPAGPPAQSWGPPAQAAPSQPAPAPAPAPPAQTQPAPAPAPAPATQAAPPAAPAFTPPAAPSQAAPAQQGPPQGQQGPPQGQSGGQQDHPSGPPAQAQQAPPQAQQAPPQAQQAPPQAQNFGPPQAAPQGASHGGPPAAAGGWGGHGNTGHYAAAAPKDVIPGVGTVGKLRTGAGRRGFSWNA